jgi:Protein of unknown function (DUF616)
MNRCAVFTAISGNYDALRSHPVMPGVDWIAFLDAETLTTNIKHSYSWEVRPIEVPADITHPRTRAKWYKVLSQLELPEYERTLWIDGKVQLKDSDFVTTVLNSVETLAMFRHPERDCIYAEASATRHMRKYQDEPIDAQIQYYSDVYDHPEHWGLWESGIIGRKRCAMTERIEHSWWNEIEQWSNQDQLSLPIVFRAEGYTPDRIKGNMWTSKSFNIYTHNPEVL